jgi:hypothetical protein
MVVINILRKAILTMLVACRVMALNIKCEQINIC